MKIKIERNNGLHNDANIEIESVMDCDRECERNSKNLVLDQENVMEHYAIRYNHISNTDVLVF